MQTKDNALDLTGLSILVLEDEFLIAMAIEDILRQAGSENVATAKTIHCAKGFLNEDLHAAILDVRVPDGTSYELAKELLSLGIAVTFHSGHSETEDMRDFENAEFCAKPATPDELVRAVLRSRERLSA